MQRGEQKQHADGGDTDTLEDAQRTGFQMQHRLRIPGVTQQPQA
jgi:hypothetical protein